MKQTLVLAGLWEEGGLGTRKVSSQDERKNFYYRTFDTFWLLNTQMLKNICTHIGK